MAENASDFTRALDTNPHTNDLEITLGLGMFPRLTRAQFNTLRAAASSGGYTAARDTLATFKPGIAPWVDLFTSHPTDPTKIPAIRDRWVWTIISQGDVPAPPPL